ncbi:hypothetical protein ACS0TY_030880 [Phlomoides rotata]
MVLESLGLGKYEEEHMDSTTYVVRFTKYDGSGSCETKLGLSSHTVSTVFKKKRILCFLILAEVKLEYCDGFLQWRRGVSVKIRR